MYHYDYKYFCVPNDYGAQFKTHIIRPHMTETLCGRNGLTLDTHSLAYDLRQDCRMCVLCLQSLRGFLNSRGTDAVALHVFKSLVDRLSRLEQP